MSQFNSNVYDNNVVSFRTFLNRVFQTMAIGLAISGIVAFLVSINFYNIVYALGNSFYIFMLICIFGELGVGIYFSARLMKMSKSTAWICYVIYSTLTGLSLAIIVQGYTTGSVLFAFISTVILFACMAIIGQTTNVDLTKFSSLFMIGLVGFVIVTVLNNWIFRSTVMDLLLCYVGVILFLGLIAYDIQKLHQFYSLGFSDPELMEKITIYGAFELYLDFLNLFMRCPLSICITVECDIEICCYTFTI